MNTPFKICTNCGHVWQTRENFFRMENLILLGFQAHMTDGNKSALLFYHDTSECHTTIAIGISAVYDLIPGFQEAEVALNSENCPGLCLTDNHLKSCVHPTCRNAMVRRFMHLLVQRNPQKRSIRSIF